MRSTIQDSILTFSLETPQPNNLSNMAAEPQSQCFCLFLGVVYSGIEYTVHYVVLTKLLTNNIISTPSNSEIICGQNVSTKVVCGIIFFFEKKPMLKI